MTTHEALANQRAVKLTKSKADGALWPIGTGAKVAGLQLVQAWDGEIFLTRASRDGYVQAYRLRGADGYPLFVDRTHRPDKVRR